MTTDARTDPDAGREPAVIAVADLLEAVRQYAAVVTARREELIDLDAAIGDADHGANLDRGMQEVVDKLGRGPSGEGASLRPKTPGEVLNAVATTLISTVGGAAGPLYGTAFLRMAGSGPADAPEWTAADLVRALRAGYDGLAARGKAVPGDKTMVDAWGPAVDAAERALADGADLGSILRQAADAAETGMRDTIPLVARKGRASYLGERSAGHRDPGATSTALLFRAMADVIGPR